MVPQSSAPTIKSVNLDINTYLVSFLIISYNPTCLAHSVRELFGVELPSRVFLLLFEFLHD